MQHIYEKYRDCPHYLYEKYRDCPHYLLKTFFKNKKSFHGSLRVIWRITIESYSGLTSFWVLLILPKMLKMLISNRSSAGWRGVGPMSSANGGQDGFCVSESPGSPVIEITDVAQAESVKAPLFLNFNS